MAQLRDWLLWAGGAGLALGTEILGRWSSEIPPLSPAELKSEISELGRLSQVQQSLLPVLKQR